VEHHPPPGRITAFMILSFLLSMIIFPAAGAEPQLDPDRSEIDLKRGDSWEVTVLVSSNSSLPSNVSRLNLTLELVRNMNGAAMLSNNMVVLEPGGKQPISIIVDVPRNALPGDFQILLLAREEGTNLTSQTSINVSVTKVGDDGRVDILTIGLMAVVVVLGTVLASYMKYRRDRLGFVIHGALLIYRDGRVLAKAFPPGERPPDENATAAMLMALGNFVRETTSESGSLKEVEHGDVTFTLHAGTDVILAVIIRGKPSRFLHNRMKETVEEVEERYSSELSGWNGRSNAMPALPSMLKRFLKDF